MGQEIERKFLVKDDGSGDAGNAGWRTDQGLLYRQGYLSTDKARTVRVRLVASEATGEAWGYLTIKGKSTGASRAEYEYPIPAADASELLDTLCHQPLIEKIRHRISVGDDIWEVDEFLGVNAGLVIAEIELAAVDQPFAHPDWVGSEVTDDPRYYNSNLVAQPFSQW